MSKLILQALAFISTTKPTTRAIKHTHKLWKNTTVSSAGYSSMICVCRTSDNPFISTNFQQWMHQARCICKIDKRTLTRRIYQSGIRRFWTVWKTPPMTQFVLEELRVWWRDIEALTMAGPLYRVTTNAPVIDIMVPITLAWLLLRFSTSFSIIKYQVWDLSSRDNACINVRFRSKKKKDLKRIARMKVKAGVRLLIKEERVGEP